MSECRDSFVLAAPTSHVVVEGRQIIVFGMGNGPRDFKQDGSQVRIPFGGLATEPLAPTLLVPWADPGPGGEMFVGSKARHVRANLSDHTGCGGLSHAHDALHQRHGFLARDKLPLQSPL